MDRKQFTWTAVALFTFLAGLIVRAAEPTDAEPAHPVYSMREFELKSGVKPEQFEAFVQTELAKAVGTDSGMKLHILRGDRGDRKGAYLLVWEFDSVAARNRYFPKEGGESNAEYQKAWDHMKTVMSKFSNYVNEHFAYTDYVQISN
jgi:hypothetical protein